MKPMTGEEVTLRLLTALTVGLVLGFERERHGRAAGLRTTMLVCVSAAVAMILSEHLFLESSQGNTDWRPDPARLAAGVLAGMGFLGAGVIIRQDNAIHGVTTAAVLWFSAMLGMALGSGNFMLGFSGFAIAAVTLFILPGAESYIQADRYALLTVLSSLPGPSQKAVIDGVEQLGMGAKLKPASIELDQALRQKVMTFEVKIKRGRVAECQPRAVGLVSRLKGVKRVKWA